MPCGVEATNGWPLKNVAWISLGVGFPPARAAAARKTAALPASTARMREPPLDFVPGMIEQAWEKPLRVFGEQSATSDKKLLLRPAGAGGARGARGRGRTSGLRAAG